MTVEIKIFLQNENCCGCLSPHCLSSSKAVVRDLNDKSKVFSVLYADEDAMDDRDFAQLQKYMQLPDYKASDTYVTLYSNQPYDEFVKLYNAKFSDRESFSCITKKCSDACSFMLDYFFPEEKYRVGCVKEALYLTTICLTLGLFRCVTPSSVMTTPESVFRRAKKIEASQKEKRAEEKAEISSLMSLRI